MKKTFTVLLGFFMIVHLCASSVMSKESDEEFLAEFESVRVSIPQEQKIELRRGFLVPHLKDQIHNTSLRFDADVLFHLARWLYDEVFEDIIKEGDDLLLFDYAIKQRQVNLNQWYGNRTILDTLFLYEQFDLLTSLIDEPYLFRFSLETLVGFNELLKLRGATDEMLPIKQKVEAYLTRFPVSKSMTHRQQLRIQSIGEVFRDARFSRSANIRPSLGVGRRHGKFETSISTSPVIMPDIVVEDKTMSLKIAEIQSLVSLKKARFLSSHGEDVSDFDLLFTLLVEIARSIDKEQEKPDRTASLTTEELQFLSAYFIDTRMVNLNQWDDNWASILDWLLLCEQYDLVKLLLKEPYLSRFSIETLVGLDHLIEIIGVTDKTLLIKQKLDAHLTFFTIPQSVSDKQTCRENLVLDSLQQVFFSGENKIIEPDVREVSFLLVPSRQVQKVTSSIVTGPAGCKVKLSPQGKQLKIDVTLSEKVDLGVNRWDIALYAEDKTWQPFTLSITQERGARWSAEPYFIRIPVVGKDYSTLIYIKPVNLTAIPANFDPTTIIMVPKWDHVTFVPEDMPSSRGIPCRLTIGAEMIRSWKLPKTFYVIIPGHGFATLYMKKDTLPTWKIIPPSLYMFLMWHCPVRFFPSQKSYRALSKG